MKATAAKKQKAKEPDPEPAKVAVRPAGVSIGRIVTYTLTEQDAEEISRRRTTGPDIQALMAAGRWPSGSQAHIGTPVAAGDRFPIIVTKISPDQFGLLIHGVSGQVFLDGNDVLWVAQRIEGPDPGQWAWPARV
jgi:hypothetical protein